MKKTLFAIATIFVFIQYSCKNDAVAPDEKSIIGTYTTVDNPLLCAMPTMSDLNIKSDGRKYKMTLKHISNSSKEEISNVSVVDKDSTTVLMRNGSEIGRYLYLKYSDITNGDFVNREGMVLMLRFESDNKHYEYMGRK